MGLVMPGLAMGMAQTLITRQEGAMEVPIIIGMGEIQEGLHIVLLMVMAIKHLDAYDLMAKSNRLITLGV